MPEHSLVPIERIERVILVIRGHKVMLDTDLALLYEVETKALNRAVKRNLDCYPTDFMFQLTEEEAKRLRFQSGTLEAQARQAGDNIASTFPTPSPSRAWPCCRACCAASAPFR